MEPVNSPNQENEFVKMAGGLSDGIQNIPSDNLPKNEPEENEFIKMAGGTPDGALRTSESGSFVRSAIGSALPAAGSLIGGGAGSAIGTVVGAGAGAAAGSAIPIVGTATGAAAGGFSGALAGATYGSVKGGQYGHAAQDWIFSKLPESWVEAIGQNPDQKALDELANPNSTFIGGLAPFAVTMNPLGTAGKAVAGATTALKRIMSSDIGSRMISGAVSGGFELGQEAYQGDHLDWQKAAISTGFGVIFNMNNRIGHALDKSGRALSYPLTQPATRGLQHLNIDMPAVMGASFKEHYPDTHEEPVTIAQASDLDVLGPGVTQDVISGHSKRNPSATELARKDVRDENELFGLNNIEHDIHEVARRLDPETIDRHDELQTQRKTLNEWVNEHEENGTLNSEDHKRVENNISKIDQELDSLSTRYTSAYKNASDMVPSSKIEEVAIKELPPEIQEKISPPGRPIEAQRQAISDEISKNLQAIGKTPEEAKVQADLQAKYYAMRAYRFEGKRGTAEDFYLNEAPGLAKHIEGLSRQDKSKVLYPEKAFLNKNIESKAAWDEFLNTRKSFSKEPDVWNVGDIVNREKIKDLLVLNKNENGNTLLLGKPDREGMSAYYVYNKEGELIKNKAKTDFEEATKAFRQSKESTDLVLEQRVAKKDQANGYIENLLNNKRSLLYLAEHSNPSSYIHEMSHQWLVDLINDANHPLAPKSLKDDAASVIKELNIKNYNGIHSLKRDHHEQFARWGEQYVRQGISPSRDLDRVFSKFREWLTDIYQTIKDLGRPISPEIRGVFDRMLAESPEPRAIVPEKSRGPTLHDIHEADAKVSIPHPEAPEADRINHETNRYVQDLPKEIKDELESGYAGRSKTVEPKSENAEGSARSGEVEDGLSSGRLIAASEVFSATSDQVATSRNSGTSEVSRSVSRDVEDAIKETPKSGIENLAPVLHEDSISSETKDKRKAANIVLENITHSEDVKKFLEDAASSNDEFSTFRKKTPLTDGERVEFSDDFGLGEAQMKKLFEMSRIVSENVVPAKKLLVDATLKFQELRDKWLETRSHEDAIAAYSALEKQNVIQGYFCGYEANVGRSLGNFRKSKMEFKTPEQASVFLKENAGMTLFQLENILERSTLAQSIPELSKFARMEVEGRKWGTMLHEYYTNSLLSNIKNQVIYTVGTGLEIGWKYMVEKPGAVGVGKLMEILGREGDRSRAGEIKYFFKQLASPDHFVAAKESFTSGTGLRLPGEKISRLEKEASKNDFSLPEGYDFAHRHELKENTKWSDLLPKRLKADDPMVVPAMAGLMHGIEEAFTLAPDNFKNRDIMRSSPLFQTLRSNKGAIPDILINGKYKIPLGSIIRAPNERANRPLSDFITSFVYATEKNQSAYTQAFNEGLTGTAREARIADLIQNPPMEKMQEFTKAAHDMALIGESGKVSKALDKLIDLEVGETGLKPLRFIVPFSKVVFQVLDKSLVERTVLGFGSERVRNDLLGRNGNIAQDAAIFRVAAGTPLVMLAGWYFYGDRITGSGPSDYGERQAWMAAGYQPYSVKIGDSWYNYGKLGPLAKVLGMGADFASIAHQISEKDLDAGAKQLSYAAGSLFLDETPFTALSNFMKAINDPEGKGQKLITSLTSNFVPFSSALRQVTKWEDPHMKSAEGFLQNLMKGLPGLSHYVPERRDIWGETIEYGAPQSDDPVRLYPASAGFGMAMPPKKIGGVPLTQDQYDDLARISGNVAYRQISKAMKSEHWQKASPELRHDIYKESFKQAREAASGEVLRKYPDLRSSINQVVKDKKKMARGQLVSE